LRLLANEWPNHQRLNNDDDGRQCRQRRHSVYLTLLCDKRTDGRSRRIRNRPEFVFAPQATATSVCPLIGVRSTEAFPTAIAVRVTAV